MAKKRRYPRRPPPPPPAPAAKGCTEDCPECGAGGSLRMHKYIMPDDICWLCVNTYKVKPYGG